MSKRKLWDKLLILSHKAVFLIQLFTFYTQWQRRRERGKKRKKDIVFQSQDLHTIYLFSLPSYLSFPFLCPHSPFHSQVRRQTLLQVPHLVLKQSDDPLHQQYCVHVLQNEGATPLRRSVLLPVTSYLHHVILFHLHFISLSL